ncbi:class C sortase [Pontibacillus litoralis]|nr:class C sortase [Pontibacillus litoralis]
MRKYIGVIIIFLVGLGIVIYPHFAQWFNGYMQSKQVKQFQTELETYSKDDIEEMMSKADACNKDIYYDESGFHDPFVNKDEKLEKFKNCLGVEDDEMFSAIEIPKLGLLIPIYLGATEDILDKGIGQIEGSSIPIGGDSTHTVLAGHRGLGTKEMFRNVDELETGDKFYIHTMDETLTYQVYTQKVIEPHETESLEIKEGKDLATLFTCHPYRYDYQRLLIQAERIN